MKLLNIILTLILIIVIIWFFKTYVPTIGQRDAEYNTYQCAVQGYQADCKTPLPANQRLK